MSRFIDFRLVKYVAYLVCLLSLFSGCSSQEHDVKLPLRPVKVFRIQSNSEGVEAHYAGEVRPRFETVLSFRVAGKLIDKPVETGDFVRKGQLLARLDSSDFSLSVEALKAQINSAETDSNFAKEDLSRYRELLDQKVISNPDFDRHQTAYTNATQRVIALEAQLKQAVNQLKYTELLADRDGVVIGLEAETGQVVAAGQPVIKLSRREGKEIQFDLPELTIHAVKSRQQVAVSLWPDDTRKFRAEIREISATADPSSRTYRVRATLLEGQEQARLGMTATVWFSSDKNVHIAVPLSAVFTSQAQPKQQKVWLVDEMAHTVKAVPVHAGPMLADERISVDGLQPGQLIVSAGVQRLKEGQIVRMPGSEPFTVKAKEIENSGKQP